MLVIQSALPIHYSLSFIVHEQVVLKNVENMTVFAFALLRELYMLKKKLGIYISTVLKQTI